MEPKPTETALPDQLKITPALPSDIPHLISIQFSAFENDPYHQALYPGDQALPSVRAQAGDRMLQTWTANPYQRVMECVSSRTGVILGFALWSFYEQSRSEDLWMKEPIVDWAEGSLKERAEAFLGTTAAMRRKVCEGRPHGLLELLCVHQACQRQGAGTALVRWGLEQCERLNLAAHLEASVAGGLLYRKMGFSEIDVMVVDAKCFDGERDQRYIVMVKHPERPTAQG